VETLKDQLKIVKKTLSIVASKQGVEKDDNTVQCPRCYKYIRKIYLVDHLEHEHNEITISDRTIKIKRKKNKLIKKTCSSSSCKENVDYLAEKNKPKFCKESAEKKKKKRKNTKLKKIKRKKSKRKKSKARYARVSFEKIRGYSVQGGAPGLGKRR